MSYFAAPGIFADEYNVNIVDKRDRGNLKKFVCDRVQASKLRRNALLCLLFEELVVDDAAALAETSASKVACPQKCGRKCKEDNAVVEKPL